MKVIGLSSRSQKQKDRKCLFPQCKTSIGNNSGSIEHKSHEVCVQHIVSGYGGPTGVTANFVT